MFAGLPVIDAESECAKLTDESHQRIASVSAAGTGERPHAALAQRTLLPDCATGKRSRDKHHAEHGSPTRTISAPFDPPSTTSMAVSTCKRTCVGPPPAQGELARDLSQEQGVHGR